MTEKSDTGKRKSSLRLIVRCVFFLIAVAALLLFLHYVPFDLPSYCTWFGITLSFIGLVSIVVPLRFLRIRSRRQALILLPVAVVVAVAADFWPAPVMDVGEPKLRLDDFLPRYQFVEYHETRVLASMNRVIEAMQKVSLADMPPAVYLMRLRDLASGVTEYWEPDRRPILEMFLQSGAGFLPLDTSNPREVVYGLAGKPWTNETPPFVDGPEAFMAFDTPGHVKVAFNLRCVDEGEGKVLISTETRIMGNDEEAQRIFPRYWRLIYPGSSIIRRVWLDAIASLALQET